MSKRDCNRKGYLKGSVRSRIVCEKQLISIEKTAKDKKEIRKPQLHILRRILRGMTMEAGAYSCRIAVFPKREIKSLF